MYYFSTLTAEFSVEVVFNIWECSVENIMLPLLTVVHVDATSKLTWSWMTLRNDSPAIVITIVIN